MRNKWIICPMSSAIISSVNPISKGLYYKQAIKIFDGLKLTRELSGSDCGFSGFLRACGFFGFCYFFDFFFPLLSDKNHFGKESSGTECESICFFYFLAALEFKYLFARQFRKMMK